MRILIVGAGNMGKTYAESFTNSHILPKEDLYILEKRKETIEDFRKMGFHQVYDSAAGFISEVDVIILAVKPQDASSILQAIQSYIFPHQVLLSVMAGVKIASIKQLLPNVQKIIRAMPNLPAQIGMGMTGFTSCNAVSKEEVFMIHNLLSSTGKCLYFDDEAKLDAVTAISGSGPAYVYFFMEAMINSAIKMGFSKVQAEMLVEQTFMGAIHLQNNSTLSCSDWIDKVASKGGTTEAALQKFNEKELQNSIEAGLQNAWKRAIELGG